MVDVGLQELLEGYSLEFLDMSRFKLLKKQCDTMQGAVHLALDTRHNTKCILKTASRELVAAGKSRKGTYIAENVLNETAINALFESAQSVDHREKGLTRFIGVGIDSENIYVVTEYNEGGDLFEYVKAATALQRDIDEAQRLVQTRPRRSGTAWIRHVQAIFRSLVSAVHYMHRNFVAHSDLSLENVMLAGTKGVGTTQVKIIDLGLARHFPDGDFRSHLVCGKTGYMPPEMNLGQCYDARSADIWCMGLMLFLMLIRTPPFAGASPEDLFFRYIIDGRIGELLCRLGKISLVTDDALDLLSKMLRYEKDRITMYELLKHPFVAIESEDSSKKTKESGSTLTASAAAEDCSIRVTPTTPRLSTRSALGSLTPAFEVSFDEHSTEYSLCF